MQPSTPRGKDTIMKKSLHILLFTCITCLGVASAQNASATSCIVFQPDNRTTNLSATEVNTIWQTIERLASASATTMPRKDFLDFATSIGLQPTGSNLRNEQELRGRIVQNTPYKNLIFTRITRWGNHFNVSMEKISLPDFTLTRANLPLSAKITTLEQLLDKLPSLMNQLGLAEKVMHPLDKPLILSLPPKTDNKPLQTFCKALQKHLSAGGVKTSVQSSDAMNDNAIMVYVEFDQYDYRQQTLDLPMQKRQLLKTSINLSGRLFMEADGEKTTLTFSKSDSRTREQETVLMDENAFLDAVARDTARQIIQKLNARKTVP